MRILTITLFCVLLQWGFSSAATAAGDGPDTGLQWQRNKYGDSIQVTATRRGTELVRAQKELEAVADRLDAIRTFVPHVVWSILRWEDGNIEIMARAESALYANVATMSIRRLFPGRSSAGTGIQQLRSVPASGFKWRVRMLLTDRGKKKGEKLKTMPQAPKKAQ